MLKVVSLMRRADGMSKQEFITWITEEHVAFARENPGLRKFVVNATDVDADTPWDSVNELYFDDEDARAAAFASESGKAAADDAGAHTAHRVHVLTTEHELL